MAVLGYLGKVLELTGLILVGSGLWEGLAGRGLRTEFQLTAAGVVIFLLGRWVESRGTGRRD